MPRPVYIICSESGVTDRVTGLVSFFNTLETITTTLTILPKNSDRSAEYQQLSFFTAAVWMQEEGEEQDQEYEYQTVLRIPGAHQENVVAQGTFKFSAPLQRIQITIRGRPFMVPGILYVESRIRAAVGDGSWLKQDYPLRIEVKKIDETNPQGEPPPQT